MLRIIFTSIMILHGMFHLVGFLKESQLGTQTSARIMNASESSRFAGAGWLIASLLFIIAGFCYLLRREWYWIPAVAALLVSQILVIIYWEDARYATVINVIILLAAFYGTMVMRFNNQTKREVQTLLANSARSEITVTEEAISALPSNVQRWLRQSGVVGRSLPATARITQRGTMRTKPGGSWMPFTATQFFSINPPAFVWSASIQAAPLVTIAGRDKYENGHGNMVIRPLYIFNAANSSGDPVDQGTLLRYVAEMGWFPHAAVSDYLTWEGVSDNEARVTMTYGGISASGLYRFDEEGRAVGFEAERYGDFGGVYKKEIWSITTKAHKSLGGLHIGSVSEVTWKLQEGDFHWLTLEVTQLTSAEAGN